MYYDALEDVESSIPSSDSILINYNYDSSNTLIATFNSTSDVNTFCNTYNHSDNYNGLKLGQRIQINDGTYNKTWYIAGFDCEYNNVASDCTIKNNGYGICLIPTTSLMSAQWNTSSDISGGYINSTMHTSTLPTIANNLKNVLGSHLINRNVLLSSEVSNRGVTKLSWNTSYCTLLSIFQCDGIGTSDYMGSIADDGEANYKLPLFNFRYYITCEENNNKDIYNSLTCNLRNVGTNYTYYISFHATGNMAYPRIVTIDITNNRPIRPMIYIR